jgi:histidine kinase/DNA gyrase B/HSP90-like ATPase
MSSTTHPMEVRSHVARDLLQNAALFKTDKLVVWEYVSNSLQYVDPGVNPIVEVMLDSKTKKITVADNGRGMDWEGLRNFFVMHGENLDRNLGHAGRGRFGTGKAAAFGIGDLLRVTSIKDRKRSTVELRRSDMEGNRSGDPIPVKSIEKEVPCSKSSGTLIEIEGIHLRALDQPGIIRYIERHLAHWPRNASVYVNQHECEYVEPPIDFSRTFVPTQEYLHGRLGDVQLTINVSKGPIEAELCGVSIYSNGVWHESTLAGSEGKEMSNYIFGEIEVPALDDDSSPIPPFDLSRSMRLNHSNEIVQAIYAFVNRSVEEVRKELLEQEKRRRSSEEAKRLNSQADEIARLINEDFSLFKTKVAKVRAKARGGADLLDTNPSTQQDIEILILGGTEPATVVSEVGACGARDEGGGGGGVPRELLPLVEAGGAEPRASRSAGSQQLRSSRGGFRVEFKSMGAEERRAAYITQERTIYVNLDHPQVVMARGGGSIEDVSFRRLVYEIAFTEYAIALASELALHGEYIEPTDPIFEIRETINRLARKSAPLYQ